MNKQRIRASRRPTVSLSGQPGRLAREQFVGRRGSVTGVASCGVGVEGVQVSDGLVAVADGPVLGHAGLGVVDEIDHPVGGLRAGRDHLDR